MKNILCLSGWAQPHDALTPLAPHATHLDYADHSLEDAITHIATHSPDVAIGWSLGGVLLMIAKAQGAINPDHLVILGSPLQYVSDESFPHGMGQDTFAKFYENMTNQPERSSEKFNHLIAYGDAHYERVLASLQSQTHQADWGAWLPWLDMLAMQHHTTMPLNSMGKMLLVYGEQDVIVSHEQGKLIAQHTPKSTYVTWPNASHALHLHDTEGLQTLIHEHTGHDLRTG